MNGAWWGQFEFAAGETRTWRLGPLEMWISRTAAEYRVAVRRDPDGDLSALQGGPPWGGPVAPDAGEGRHGGRGAARRPGGAARPAARGPARQGAAGV
nr:hypothetical protein [bacterium]